MKKKLIYICFLLCSYIINAQNYPGFSPGNQSVSVNSGEEIEAIVRVNGFGNEPLDIVYTIIPDKNIDNGFLDVDYSGIVSVGHNEDATFTFKKNVSTTTTIEYKFITIYDSTSNFGEIIINVTYNAKDEETCDLNAPSTTITTNITESSAKLDWSSVSGNDGYQYRYRKSTTSSWTTITTSSSYANKSSLSSNTLYYWKVRAKCDNDLYGDWTSTNSFTTLSGCSDSVSIATNVSSGITDDQSAKTTITATNTINSGATANYDAGTTVYLKSGFHAESGSTFKAFIEGCSATSAKGIAAVEKQAVLEEEKVLLNSDTTIYPNPTTGIFTISSNEVINSYMLFNSYNSLLLNKTVGVNKVAINIQNLSTGIYVLKITLASGKVLTKKIIKK